MATLSKNIQMNVKTSNGDIVPIYPNTKIENVDSLQTALNSKVDKVSGKGLSTNDYTTTEKNKLAGIASGATANIGTVTQVKVGTTAYNPSSGVVSLPAYPTTLPASDVYSWAKASTKPSYTASEVGAAASSHTHNYAGSSSAGGAANSAAKLTNTSKIGDTNKPVYFKADGTPAAISYTIDKSVPSNAVFTDTTYSAATQSAAGLMSSTDKTKLDGIATGANNYVHPTTSGNKHIPSGGSSGMFLKYSSDGTAVWAVDNNTHRPIQIDGTQLLGNNTTPFNLTAGGNIKILKDDSNAGYCRLVNINWVGLEDVRYLNLSSLTWTRSSSGIYYSNNVSIPNTQMTHVLGASIIDFNYLPADANLQIAISTAIASPQVWFLSATNNFSSNSTVDFRVFGIYDYDTINS